MKLLIRCIGCDNQFVAEATDKETLARCPICTAPATVPSIVAPELPSPEPVQQLKTHHLSSGNRPSHQPHTKGQIAFIIAVLLIVILVSIRIINSPASRETSRRILYPSPQPATARSEMSSSEVESLKELPSLRRFSDAEKETIINEAVRFDEAVKRLEKERGH
jgi:hypothetical protein